VQKQLGRNETNDRFSFYFLFLPCFKSFQKEPSDSSCLGKHIRLVELSSIGMPLHSRALVCLEIALKLILGGVSYSVSLERRWIFADERSFQRFVMALCMVFCPKQSLQEVFFPKHGLLSARFWKNFFAAENLVFDSMRISPFLASGKLTQQETGTLYLNPKKE
jgi:hypothetical protein